MKREYEMEIEKYKFRRNPSQFSGKLTILRQQSQASHINRIRFGSEKRRIQELERLNLEKPKWANIMTSEKTIKNVKSTRTFSLTRDLEGVQSIDDYRSLQHSVNNRHNHTAQGDIYLITGLSNSQNMNSVNNIEKKKHRKRWTKTPEATLIVPMAEFEDGTEKNGGDHRSERSLSLRNLEEFNRIRNDRDVDFLNYAEARTVVRRYATKNYGKVVQWVNSLPTPESMDPILNTIQDEKMDLHLSPKEDRLAKQIDFDKHSQLSDKSYKDAKYCRKSTSESAKQAKNTSGLCLNMPVECEDKENGFNSVSKKEEPSTPIGSEIKKDCPIQVVYTPKGIIKIVIRLKKLKPKDNALLVRFNDLKDLMLSDKNNATSSSKVKKSFTYLNDQQLKFFENIF